MSQPTSSPYMIGRYELVAHLATGGMAEIFLARERGLAGLERLVVIKRILPKLAHDTSFIDMFLREARIIARLNHPNVIQIYELGAEAGNYYIAMEYIHGSTVREMQILAERDRIPVSVDVAVSIIEQACRGLHAAHQLRDLEGTPLGLIHRDVSPHNLMCTTEGFVKVLDFGVAKASQGVEATHSGHLKGKFAYMSPEQCQGQKLDRRADIFSLGTVVWETLTGERLFKRDRDLDMMRAVVQEESPPPSRFNPAVPPAIDHVVLRALAKDRDLRYQTAEQMRTELLEACRDHRIRYGEDVLAKFLSQVAGEELTERRATLQEALERSLTSNEQRSLLHVTGSDSMASLTQESDPFGAATVVERPRPSQSAKRSDARPVPSAEGTASNPSVQSQRSPVARPSSTPSSTAGPFPDTATAPAAAGPSTPHGSAQALRGAHVVAKKPRKSRWLWSGAGFIGVVALIIFFFPPQLNIGQPGAKSAESQDLILLGEPLKIGWAPIAPEHLLEPEVSLITPYLEKMLRRPVEMYVTRTYEALSEGIRDGTYDVAMLPPLLYVQTQLAEPDLQFVALRQFGGATSSDALLVSRMDSPLANFDAMAGKTFCFTDRDSTTGYFLPRVYIRRHGYDPDKFVGKVVWSGDHLQVLRDLLAGKCDVAATYSGSYLSADNFGIPITRIRIFAVTGHVPQDTVAAKPGMPESLVHKLRDALIAFDPQKELGTPEAGEVLRMSGFSSGSDDEFNDLREAVKYSRETE